MLSVVLKSNFRLMLYFFSFHASRNKEDVEKMVLPAIVYINTNHEAFTDVRRKGFMICIGWWDWSIKVGAII